MCLCVCVYVFVCVCACVCVCVCVCMWEREIVLVQKNCCRGKCVESHFYRKLFISVSNIWKMCRMFTTGEEHSYKTTGSATHNALYTAINELQNVHICEGILNLGKFLVDWNSRWLISCSYCLRSHNHVFYLVWKDFSYFIHCKCLIFLLLLWVSSLLFCVISCGITCDVWRTWRLKLCIKLYVQLCMGHTVYVT